jgi:putative SbcD/Mre11-related phosphoesterase
VIVHDEWLLTPERVAVHLPTATAVAADLHLGYDRARRRRGDAVPLAGLEEVLGALGAVAARHGARALVVAGDLCEDAAGRALLPELRRRLGEVGLSLSGLVSGNHDRGLADPSLPLYPGGFRLGGWVVLHGDGALPEGRLVLGHFHPCLRWGPGVAAPCYLVGERRLVLPALSADAAGVNVLGERRWRGCRCAAIAGDRVLDFGELSELNKARQGGW